jgi:hypothetical protein
MLQDAVQGTKLLNRCTLVITSITDGWSPTSLSDTGDFHKHRLERPKFNERGVKDVRGKMMLNSRSTDTQISRVGGKGQTKVWPISKSRTLSAYSQAQRVIIYLTWPTS